MDEKTKQLKDRPIMETAEDFYREISFSTLNYAVTLRTSDKTDSFHQLKQISLSILREITEYKNAGGDE